MCADLLHVSCAGPRLGYPSYLGYDVLLDRSSCRDKWKHSTPVKTEALICCTATSTFHWPTQQKQGQEWVANTAHQEEGVGYSKPPE